MRLLVVICALVPALSAQVTSRALDRFRASARGKISESDAQELRAEIAALREHDSAEVTDALIDAYASLERSAEPIVVRRQPKLLRGGGGSVMEPLRQRLQPLRDLQDLLIAALQAQRSGESIAIMLRRLLYSKSQLPFTLKLALVERVGELPESELPAVFDAVESTTGDERVLVLLRAVAKLGKRATKAAAWVTEKVAHRAEVVRFEAAKALAELAYPGSLVPLIERLDDERGRVFEQLLDTLVVLTRTSPGNSASSWQLWLEQEGRPYVAGEVRLGGGDASLRNRRRDNETTTGSYFGIDQEGSAILYLFDVSRSMSSPLGGRRRDRSASSGETRWDRCRAELHAALDKLTPAKTFNLVGFADKLPMFSKKMVAATPKNIARARRWIDDLDLALLTHIYDALDLSFVIAGRGAKDRFYPLEVDTIFFLSDGAPTRPNTRGRGGGGDDPARILSAVRRWNALGRVVIHAIGLGLVDPSERGRGRRGGGRGRGGRGARTRAARDPREFMRKLAEQHGGQFVDVR